MSNSNATSKPIQREILPIPYQPYAGFVAYDAKGPVSKFAPIEELRPPKGAPNVSIILLDNVRFGASSAFGGPSQTPSPNGSRPKDCGTRVFTLPRCAPHTRCTPIAPYFLVFVNSRTLHEREIVLILVMI